LPYREWLEVISDSLDNQVDESHYHLPEISKVLDYIEADVSPEEKARMIDEYNFEEWRKEGIKERMLEMAKTMLQEGFTLAMISKLTGLDEQTVLAISMNDK
jgi:predicted transposase/invertase (TIGR01784 family)